MNRTVMWVALALIAFLVILPVVLFLKESGGSGEFARHYFHRGIDLQGGTSLLYEVGAESSTTDMKEVVNVLIKRVDPTGTKNYVITPRVGGHRLEIIMAGADPEEVRTVKSLVGRNGYLEFRICAGAKNIADADATRLGQQRLAGESLPADSIYEWTPLQFNSKESWDRAREFLFGRADASITREKAMAGFTGNDCVYVLHPTAGAGKLNIRTQVFTSTGPGAKAIAVPEAAPAKAAPTAEEKAKELADIEVLLLKNTPRITGADFSGTTKQTQDGQPIIQFSMKNTAKARLAELTGDHIKQRMAIALDGKVQGAPTIQAKLGDGGIITGYPTTQERDEVLTVLQSGVLDVNLRLLSERTLGPELGADNIRSGLRASLISLICVVGFMALYYLGVGLIADLAVLLNLIILILVMYVMGGTWTLPGVAGLILTVGMSVDANVLINERIREELRRGSTTRLAVQAGYARAFPAIFDGHLTTILTSVILAWVGSADVKGFAIVLIIGLVANLLTAVVATRAVSEFLMETGLLRNIHMLHIFPTMNIPFTKYAKVGFWVSMTLAVGGVALSLVAGQNKYAMEFRGGTSVELKFKQAVDIETVRRDVAHLDDGFLYKIALNQAADVEAVRSKVQALGAGYKDAIVLALGRTSEEGLASDFSVQVFQTQPGSTPVELQKALVLATPPAGKKVSELELGYSNAVVQPIEFADKPAKNLEYSIQVLDPDDETVKLNLKQEFKSLLATTGEMQVTVQSAVLTPAMVLEMQNGPAAKDKDKAKPSQFILEDYGKYVGAMRAQIELIGESATPAEVASRVDKYLTDQAPDLVAIAREIVPGQADAQTPGTFRSYTVYVFDPRLNVSMAPTDPADPEAVKAAAAAKVEVTRIETLWDGALREAVSRPPALVSSKIDVRIGEESWTSAMFAMFLSFLGIIGYLWFRFTKVSYGLGAVVALIHDVCIALGAVIIFSWIGRDIPFIGEMKIDLPMIGAFLTLVGYSVNDTIVVFDRIRENRGKFGELSETVINNSINQTFARTILTSLTVFIVVLILYFFGGVRSTVHGFSFVMTVGVLVGTYSSIAIAAPIVLWLTATKRRTSGSTSTSASSAK